MASYDIASGNPSFCICVDRYTWQGTAKLQQTIDNLCNQDLSQPAVSVPPVGVRKGVDKLSQQQQASSTCTIDRREKSLGLLAQRFVQMLLCVAEDQAVALDDAAKSLLGMLSLLGFACSTVCAASNNTWTNLA